jgi:hypothetical protein
MVEMQALFDRLEPAEVFVPSLLSVTPLGRELVQNCAQRVLVHFSNQL